MLPSRPDLGQVDECIREYIEALEKLIESSTTNPSGTTISTNLPDTFPPEPPGTRQVIVISRSGSAKRTPRHLYTRQRRGGMGIFDLDIQENDFPELISIADLDDTLILFTNYARAFRLPVVQITEGQIRSRGESLRLRLHLQQEEYIVSAVPFIAKGAIVLASDNGMVRHLRHHIFGEHMKAGTSLFPSNQFGQLASACVAPGDGDILIATRQGRAIRFSERLISPQGTLGIRLDLGDQVVAITSVQSDEGVLLVDSYGRGSIRLISGFAPNKSAGGSGKIAMNTDHVVGAVGVADKKEAFLISKLSKCIRFGLEEIPPKENPVQGVNVMSLRADEVVSIAIS